MSRPLVILAALVLAAAGALPIAAMAARVAPADLAGLFDARTLGAARAHAGLRPLAARRWPSSSAPRSASWWPSTDLPLAAWLGPLGVVPLLLPPMLIAMVATDADQPRRAPPPPCSSPGSARSRSWASSRRAPSSASTGASRRPRCWPAARARPCARASTRCCPRSSRAPAWPSSSRSTTSRSPTTSRGSGPRSSASTPTASSPPGASTRGPGRRSATALPLVALTLAALLPALALRRRGALATLGAGYRRGRVLPLGPWRWPAFALAAALVALAALLPIARLAFEAGGGTRPGGWSSAAFTAAFAARPGARPRRPPEQRALRARGGQPVRAARARARARARAHAPRPRPRAAGAPAAGRARDPLRHRRDRHLEPRLVRAVLRRRRPGGAAAHRALRGALRAGPRSGRGDARPRPRGRRARQRGAARRAPLPDRGPEPALVVGRRLGAGLRLRAARARLHDPGPGRQRHGHVPRVQRPALRPRRLRRGPGAAHRGPDPARPRPCGCSSAGRARSPRRDAGRRACCPACCSGASRCARGARACSDRSTWPSMPASTCWSSVLRGPARPRCCGPWRAWRARRRAGSSSSASSPATARGSRSRPSGGASASSSRAARSGRT